MPAEMRHPKIGEYYLRDMRGYFFIVKILGITAKRKGYVEYNVRTIYCSDKNENPQLFNHVSNSFRIPPVWGWDKEKIMSEDEVMAWLI